MTDSSFQPSADRNVPLIRLALLGTFSPKGRRLCVRQIAFVPNAGQAMLVPTAENDRFRLFRRGSVVSPCGRVDTRPYEAGGCSAGAWVRAPTRRSFCGRVDTRPYEAGSRRRARRYAPLQGSRRRARGYAPLRGAAFRNVGAANFNSPAGRPQILHSQFSIQPQDGGQSLAALR